MTPEQQEIADVAALRLCSIPEEHRIDVLKDIGRMYADACVREYPDMDQSLIMAHTWLYLDAVQKRLAQITASGNVIGRA
jgi:hypothetical protein